MNHGIKRALEKLREFQSAFPESHVGGSIGLMLHGIDLKRDLNKSDLDITNPCALKFEYIKDYAESSSPSDFDHSIRAYLKDSNVYVKMEIRINPEPSFEIKEFEGNIYNVSKVRDILYWKQKYADKGVKKHVDDLVVINGGERPLVQVIADNKLDDDQLPF